MPPTLRSPIVIRKFLDATDGIVSTRRQASSSSRSVTSNGGRWVARRDTFRVIFGGLPSNTDIAMSTGRLSK